MRVVIDTNRLESDELRIYLTADRTNFAVLPEHTIIEVFKIRDIDALIGSYQVLRDFPKQVLILRGNRFAARIDPRAGAVGNMLIDKEQTRGFPAFCDLISKAQKGDPHLRRQLVKRQEWANERAQAVETAFGDQSEALQQLREQFKAEDIRRLGAGEQLSDHARGLILSGARALTEDIARPGMQWIARLPLDLLSRQFTWRYCLCHLLQLVRMLGKGATRRAPAKARNDHFDNVFATYGTFFNGVMSMDTETLLTQATARTIIRSIGSHLSTDYIESGYILGVLPDPN